MSKPHLLVTLAIAIGLGAAGAGCNDCGDNHPVPGDPDAVEPPIDATPVDAPVDSFPIDANCAGPAAGTVGGPCTMDTDCDSVPGVGGMPGSGDGFCLNNTLPIFPFPAVGYCINKVTGTELACDNNDDCGAGNVCASTKGDRACFLGCAADPCACPNGMICTDSYSGTPIGTMACIPANVTSIDGATCTTFGDCDRDSICLADGFENPGGQCLQVGCTAGQNDTCTSGGDGFCTQDTELVGANTVCLDQCVTNADCRTQEGYFCISDAQGKFCRHPRTGDACVADGDCGNPALWDCKTGAAFPGGYCTLQQGCQGAGDAACSPGSSKCFDADGDGGALGYCVDRCDIPGQTACRPGYTCIDGGCR